MKEPDELVRRPTNRYEAVMWLALGAFYTCLLGAGLAIALFPAHGMYRLVFAFAVMAFGAWAGAGMARDIYQEHKAPTPPAAKFRRPE